MPIEPLNPNHVPSQALNANMELTPGRNPPEIPSSDTPKIHGISCHPWPPLAALPSIRPRAFPVQISDAVLSSLRNSIGGEGRQRLTTATLRLFLGTYFDVFNIHLPMFHAPSFDFNCQPRGILLIMAAIGALYCLEHRSAASLYWAADAAAPVGSPFQTQTSEQSTPSIFLGQGVAGNSQCLSYFQTRLLLHYFGILGGDKHLAERSLGMIAELSLTVREPDTPSMPDVIFSANADIHSQLYRTLSRRLKASSSAIDGELTWTGWLDRERTIRYCTL